MALQTYPLTVMQHEDTGHFFALCDTLPPFIAHGRTMTELGENSAGVVRRILEKQGQAVLSVEISPQSPQLPKKIKVMQLTAVAMFASAA